MKANTSNNRWILDAVLFISFLLLFFLNLTGVALHQWIGAVGGALALYHLLDHWDWIAAVSKRIFGSTTWKARLYYLVDAALLFGFATIVFSGLVISTWFSLPLTNAAAWSSFHETISIITLLLVLFKIAIHWRWIVKTTGRMVPQPQAPARLKPTIQSAVTRSGSDRRDFLKVMGIVGAATALALLNVVDSTGTPETKTTSTQSTIYGSSSTNTTAEQSSSVQSNNTSACVGSCPKGRHCSYPGQYRQYTDVNNNGRCDRGECT